MAIWITFILWLSRLILVVLFGLSIWSFALIFDKARLFKRLTAEGPFEEARKLIETRDEAALKSWSTKTQGLRAGTLRSALEVDDSKVDRAVRSYLSTERTKLESGLTMLATLGSNAPFVGLFGTVLGIIQAFGALSDAQGAGSTVMKGISEALVATAVGLFVAIPAVVGFNYFTRRVRVLLAECESLRDLYLSRSPKNGR